MGPRESVHAPNIILKWWLKKKQGGGWGVGGGEIFSRIKTQRLTKESMRGKMTLLWMMNCATVFVSEPRFSLNFVVKFVHS